MTIFSVKVSSFQKIFTNFPTMIANAVNRTIGPVLQCKHVICDYNLEMLAYSEILKILFSF